MGRLRKIGLWSLAAVTLVAWIPYAACGSAPKTAIKIVKPSAKSPSEEKIPAASRTRQQTVPLSGEDEDNYSGQQRPTFSPFPPGFSQGAPPRYPFSDGSDGPTDRYDLEESPSDRENQGMGFMPEFGPPKGFPDLSKLTGGEFGKMEAPANVGSYERAPQYSSYPRSGGKFRPFAQYSPQGDYDSVDSPSEGVFGTGPPPSQPPPQSAPKRRPFRSGRPSFLGGRPGSFGGPSGPGPYGAPEGIRGSGPYGGGPEGPYGSDGPSRPFGGRPPRPGGLFGGSSDGPSSRPGLFGSAPEGPPSRPGLFGSAPEGPPSRPGHFGSDGPSSRPGPFGGSDGPSSRPGPFGGSDGPSSNQGIFGSGSDGPSEGPELFGPGGGSDGPSGRPGLFGSDGSSSDGPSSRPSPFGGLDGPSADGPYDNSDGPSRPGSSFLSLDGPSRPGPFGGSSGRPSPFGGPPGGRPGPYGAPGSGSRGSGPPGPPGPPGPGPYSGSGRHESPSAFSFQNSNPGSGFRLSRGYPRFHPNQIQNDDYKESADNGDFTPYNRGPPSFNYPPRHQANFGSGSDDYEQGPPQYDRPGPRPRRPEFSPPHHHRQLPPNGPGNGFGPTHRFDSPKRPYVIKVSGLKSSKNSRDLPPGPPVFYAPSPDMKTKDGSRKFQVPH